MGTVVPMTAETGTPISDMALRSNRDRMPSRLTQLLNKSMAATAMNDSWNPTSNSDFGHMTRIMTAAAHKAFPLL